MPKVKAKGSLLKLPEKLKYAIVTGDAVIKMERAAKLAGIHPVILEMGSKLLETYKPEVGRGAGATFELADKQMQERGDDLLTMFVSGLKKVVRALGPGGVTAVGHRDGQRLNFLLRRAAGGPGRGKKKQATA